MSQPPRALHAVALATSLASCAAAPPCTPLRTAPRPMPFTDFSGCSSVGFKGQPSVARYAAWSADSVRHPDRIIAGARTELCQPSAIARGPRGEIYVLNSAPSYFHRRSGQVVPQPGTYWTSWITVYDSSARGDAAPLRRLHIGTRGFGPPNTLAVDRDGYLYVGSSVDRLADTGSVAVFEAGANGNAAPVRVLSGPTTGIRRPGALALDRDGHVYILNSVNSPLSHLIDDTVRVFAPNADGDVGPCRLLAGERTGVYRPLALAVDRGNRLYLAVAGYTREHRPDAVRVFDAGATGDVAPRRLITGSADRIADAMRSPHRLAIGRRDSLYVRSVANLSVFGPTDTLGPSRTFFRKAPELFALDRRDTLYAVTHDTVEVYPPGYSGGVPPVRVLGGPRTGLTEVTALALDRRGWLYVAVRDSSLIMVYPPGATGDVSPARTIIGWRTRLSRPTSLAVDDSDRLYVANGPLGTAGGGAIRVYAPGARGEDQPVRMLTGRETEVARPGAVAFDRRGEMHILQPEADSLGRVTLHRREAADRDPPLRTLRGPRTGLRRPGALAFDAAGRTYVLNPSGHGYLCHNPFIFSDTPALPSPTVTVYPPGARDDVPPVRTIVLEPVGRFQFRIEIQRGLAVDSAGAVQVWYSGTALIYPPAAEGEATSRKVVEVPPEDTEAAGLTAGEDGWVYQTFVPRQPVACY